MAVPAPRRNCDVDGREKPANANERPSHSELLLTFSRIVLFVKYKLPNCARAGNRTGFFFGGIMSNTQAYRDAITLGRRASDFGGSGDPPLLFRLLLTIRTMEHGLAEPCAQVMAREAVRVVRPGIGRVDQRL
jgi:hypothetical protein